MGLDIILNISDEEDVSLIPRKANERTIQRFTLKLSSHPSDYVEFRRGITQPQTDGRHRQDIEAFTLRSPSAHFDEIAILRHHNYGSIQGYLRFSRDQQISIINEIEKLSSPILKDLDGDSKDFANILDQNITDLQRVSLEFLERSASARDADEAAFRERERQLQNQFDEKFSELEEQRSALEAKRAELNEREPQHERRELRKSLTERLHSTIANPPTSSGQRERSSSYLYLSVGLLFMAISFGLALLSDVAQTDGSVVFWARSLKSLISGVAGAAFIWAGLSSLKAAAVASRQYEQAMQKYAFDMDRASWTVETILQMNAIEKSQVPDQWLEAVCHDLFASPEVRREEPRSLDALAALLDVTAKAKFGTGGLEFEVDRKGAKKIASEGMP